MPLLSVLVGINVASVSSLCQSDQRTILLQLKSSQIFDELSSTKLVTWDPITDCCEWKGVSCDEDELSNVVGLDLSWESISGGLDSSSALFRLLSLQRLNLAFNFLNTSLPGDFAKLTNLTCLNLSNSGFRGQIPVQFSYMTRLISLDLSIPYKLWGGGGLKLEKPNLATLVQNLTQLTDLRLDGVNISSNGKEWGLALSSSLPNLQVLSLFNFFLSGPIDPSFQRLRFLSEINLGGNNLSSTAPEFFANFSNLSVLRLSFCQLQGNFPGKIFQLPSLKIVDLSNNPLLQGSFPEFSQNLSLQTLMLSATNFSGSIPQTLGNLTQIVYLDLSLNRGFCFPLTNLKDTLDLSSNKLEGTIPTSIFDLGRLSVLSLSSNRFNGTLQLDLVRELGNLTRLDLSYNNLTVNASFSNFAKSSFPQISTLKLASCNLRMFPDLSNQSSLSVLDLSDNQITGTVPQWICDGSLAYLNLSRNFLVGLPKPFFPPRVSILDLHHNQLQGDIPNPPPYATWEQSHEWRLPRILITITSLKVLVVRNNNFSGPIGCNYKNGTWPKLQIVDLASNNFSGTLPLRFSTWEAMTADGIESHDRLTFQPFKLSRGLYYQDSIRVTLKGFELELVKILTVFTSIDFSCNKFEGKISALIGRMNSLHVLNLSHNALTGQIPSVLGNLSQLESLDLSNNDMTGEIPQQLAKLTFLSVLNLSNNRLFGMIPTGSQFQTFSSDSFEGNEGLCGPPLNESCPPESPPPSSNRFTFGLEIDWNVLSFELGCIFGLGTVIGPLMFWKRWRIWYYRHVDRVLFRIFPHLEVKSWKQNRRRAIGRRGAH
ncbi:hypothetical protein Tsubulata_033909, partial [Turnera subulata]